jgi:hypothetical protein
MYDFLNLSLAGVLTRIGISEKYDSHDKKKVQTVMVNNSTNIKQTTTIISHLKSLNIIKKKQQERHINVARSNQLAGGQTS